MFGEQYMTSRELAEARDQRSIDSERSAAQRERFEVPSDEEVKETNAVRILEERGWYREDTCFMSLNLTPEQMATISVAYAESGMSSIEEFLTEAVRRGK